MPFFYRDRVPVEVIEVPNPDIAGLTPDQYELAPHALFRRVQSPGLGGQYGVSPDPEYIQMMSVSIDTGAEAYIC